jgi:uncharacterized protein YjbI with pentapeptide repeats
LERLRTASGGPEVEAAEAGRYIGEQDSPVDADARPEFERLELDEDGEAVGVRVVGARHAGDDFARARLVDVELVRCDLSGCDFSEAAFHRVRLVDCRATSIELGGAIWRMVQAGDCRFDDANFRNTRLEQSRVEASSCARADFGAARLDRVQLTDCDLTAADFSNARCTELDLRGARLEQVKGIGSLRGAIIGPEQLYGLAPGLASALGIAVREPDDDG